VVGRYQLGRALAHHVLQHLALLFLLLLPTMDFCTLRAANFAGTTREGRREQRQQRDDGDVAPIVLWFSDSQAASWFAPSTVTVEDRTAMPIDRSRCSRASGAISVPRLTQGSDR